MWHYAERPFNGPLILYALSPTPFQIAFAMRTFSGQAERVAVT
jgi:hypothetical protein